MATFLPVNSFCRLFLRRNCIFYSLNRTMSDHPVKEIKFKELKHLLSVNGITLIDVREPKELLEDGKIPNSQNIPSGEIENAFKLPSSQFQSKYCFPKPEKSGTFALSCRSGKRVTVAYNKLVPLGYENALVYLGSFQDWVKNGGPVEK